MEQESGYLKALESAVCYEIMNKTAAINGIIPCNYYQRLLEFANTIIDKELRSSHIMNSLSFFL